MAIHLVLRHESHPMSVKESHVFGQISTRERLAKQFRRSLSVAVAGLVAVAPLVMTTGGASASSAPVTLTVWQNGNPADWGLGFMPDVIKSFEKTHPGVTINMVVKPNNSFFALLTTSFLARNGPDVAEVYAGTYLNQILPFLANLNPYVSASLRNSLPGIQYYSKNSNTNLATYGLPTENQFYNGWYNKALFKKVGISAPPTDFAQMAADCKIFSAKGIQAFADGDPSIVTSGAGAVQDWSYLVAGAYPLKKWNGILKGTIPWNSAPLVKQVKAWASLYSQGCTSKTITTDNAGTLFTSGKAAMVFNFNFMWSTYVKALGSNLGVMVQPWSSTPHHALVQYPGVGYAVNKNSAHLKLAAEFAAYTVSVPAQKMVAASGNIPVLSSIPATGAQAQLQQMAKSGMYKLYPMFDNYMPSQVVAVLDNALPEAFIGRQSPASALQVLQQAFSTVPASQKLVNYHLGGS
jgi:ABC-type glycerol-3-phosphate transport system substrate-binding protein